MICPYLTELSSLFVTSQPKPEAYLELSPNSKTCLGHNRKPPVCLANLQQAPVYSDRSQQRLLEYSGHQLPPLVVYLGHQLPPLVIYLGQHHRLVQHLGLRVVAYLGILLASHQLGVSSVNPVRLRVGLVCLAKPVLPQPQIYLGQLNLQLGAVYLAKRRHRLLLEAVYLDNPVALLQLQGYLGNLLLHRQRVS